MTASFFIFKFEGDYSLSEIVMLLNGVFISFENSTFQTVYFKIGLNIGK